MFYFDIIDAFAGHGWDVAAKSLGLPDPLGIEWDDAAVKTRIAAKMPTLQDDIALLNPRDFGAVTGFIASPPCQAWSAAGGNLGKLDKADVIQCALDMAAGVDNRHIYTPGLHDPRSLLTVEPLRWALALRPEWIAFEQVPPVLELWKLFAGILREKGYSATAGMLQAEQFGVPQTRKRAFMVARLNGEAKLPEPTHEKYIKGVERGHTDLLPWVSMAEALGWDRGVMRSNYGTGGDPAKRGERESSEPSPTITGKVGRNLWTLSLHARPNSTERAEDEPAPTMAFGHDAASARWRFAGAGRTAEQTAGQIPLETDQPAHTITGKGTATWVAERPSTAVCADPRIMAPGRHDPKVSGSQMAGAIRVTVAEAATLQSYPADFPFQGSKTKQFQQIGNAVPPLLARAVLEEVSK